MELQKATDSDMCLLGEMNKRLIEDEGHSNPMTVQQLTDRMRSFINNKYTAYLINDGLKTVGYCLFRDDHEYIYIRQLFVERNKRRCGYGKSCIMRLKENLWQDRKIRMDVLCKNSGGIEFWRKVGFQDYCITMEMTSE